MIFSNCKVFRYEEEGAGLGDAVSDDDRVLALRNEGRSFGRIARTVGLPSGRAALDAFDRTLRLQPPDQRTSLRQAELARQRQVVARLRGLLLAN